MKLVGTFSKLLGGCFLGTDVFVAGTVNCILLWKLERPLSPSVAPCLVVEHEDGKVYSLRAISPTQFLCACDEGVAVWELDVSTEGHMSLNRVTLLRSVPKVGSLRTTEFNTSLYLPESNLVVGACGNGCLFGWDLDTGKMSFSLDAHEGAILDLRIDGNRVVTGSTDGSICFWDMEAQSKTRTLLPFGEALANSLAVTCLDVHPEEELLAVGGDAPFLTLWDIRACARTSVLPTSSFANDVEFFNNKVVSTGNESRVSFWGLNGALLRDPELPSPFGYALCPEPYAEPSQQASRLLAVTGLGRVDLIDKELYSDTALTVSL